MAVVGLGDDVALRGQAGAQEAADRRLVIDDEHPERPGAEGHIGSRVPDTHAGWRPLLPDPLPRGESGQEV